MRYRSRLVVTLLLLTLISVSGWQDEHPRAVDRVSATVETQTPVPSPLLDGPQQIYARSGLSTRDIQSLAVPTPIPTPVLAPVPALRWPLAVKARITTYFHSWHHAIDLEAKCGTAVLSAKSGRVTFAGWKTNGGGYVITITSGGFVISYDHLSRIITTKDAYATAGMRIGSVGATGNATGCHLHFAVLLNGRAVNPLRYL